ncbi:MAG: TRAP transporter [Proteobacteria bacterium SG_bin9]|nr:MAG: TRAP transporter [Proteobacteria bacterium SG_bin9]
MNETLKNLMSRSTEIGTTAFDPSAPRTPRARRIAAFFIALAATLAVLAMSAAAYYYSMRPVTLRISVGPPNSDDQKVVQALAQAFARERSKIRLRVIPVEGTTAAATSIANGTTDLAIVRGDLDLPKEALAVATLRKNVAVLWAPPRATTPRAKGAAKGKPIKKITDLAGKKIGVIGRTPANVNLLKVILDQYGIKPDKYEVVQFSTTGFAEAVKGQNLDAFMAVGPVNSRITADAINATTREGALPTFLAIDAADAIDQKYPAYESAEIPAGAYGNDKPDDAIKTIGFNHHIVARKALPETTVAAFTRQIFSMRQSVLAEYAHAAKLEAPDTDKDASLPAHPGAAAYVDGEEKTFLEKYSDYIWFGFMGLSVLGSAGAWFAGYMRKDERISNSSRRDRLLEMIAIVRKSNNTEEIDELQIEADDIMRDTLNCFEHGAIEEGTLTAFNIALEQFHNAVADRKLLLMSMPPSPARPSVQLRA